MAHMSHFEGKNPTKKLLGQQTDPVSSVKRFYFTECRNQRTMSHIIFYFKFTFSKLRHLEMVSSEPKQSSNLGWNCAIMMGLIKVSPHCHHTFRMAHSVYVLYLKPLCIKWQFSLSLVIQISLLNYNPHRLG